MSLANINPLIGNGVQHLTISRPLRLGYPAHIIRDSLQLAHNLDTLVLILPVASPITVLNGVVLPRLRVPGTNLPHRALLVFLTLHPSITGLSLNWCGSCVHCPLRDLDLACITNLHCLACCLQGIVRSQVEVATINLTHLTLMATLVVRALSTSLLYSLAIEFFSDNYNILSCIVAAAPLLHKLKLVEKPSKPGTSSV